MALFAMTASLLSLLAAGFVLAPLFLGSRRELAERQAVNVALYRERLTELEASGLPEPELEALRTELQQQLLQDTEAGQAAVMGERAAAKGRPLILVAAVLVPLLAFFVYSDLGLSLGAASDVERAEIIKDIDLGQPGGLEALVAELAATLPRQADNHQGWYLLAQGYMQLGQFDAAADVFARLMNEFAGDAGLTSQYAQARYLAADRELTPAVAEAVDAALALNPHDVSMLEIRGMDAFATGDLATARDYFARALPMVQGERAVMVQSIIQRIDASLGTTPAAAPVDEVALDVAVTLAANVTLAGDETLFVFARAIDGPPMPLAVYRGMASELPLSVRLTEAMAMMPEMSLTQFPVVEVVARISRGGGPTLQDGDLQAISVPITVADQQDVIRLEIAMPGGAGQ